MCAFGLGGNRDVEEAIRYYERAAEKGHAISMIELAQLYQEPECRNYQKAFEWAKKGAVTGDPTGEFILGNLYFFGRGCVADMNNAMKYYKRALDHGIIQAEFMMKKIKMK
jgi:TPR repeat protein